MKHTLIALLLLAAPASQAQTTTWVPATVPVNAVADIGADGTVAFAWVSDGRVRIGVSPASAPVWGRSVGDPAWVHRVSAVRVADGSVWTAGSSRPSGAPGQAFYYATIVRAYPAADTVLQFGQQYGATVPPSVNTGVDIDIRDIAVDANGQQVLQASHSFSGPSGGWYPARWSSTDWNAPQGYFCEWINPNGNGDGLHISVSRSLAVGERVWTVGQWSNGIASSVMYFRLGRTTSDPTSEARGTW